SGGSTTGGVMSARGGEIRPEDETTDVAIAGSGRDVHVAVAGGPAGAFIYALLPYGGGLAICEIIPPRAWNLGETQWATRSSIPPSTRWSRPARSHRASRRWRARASACGRT